MSNINCRNKISINNARDFLLATLSAGGAGVIFNPVHIQKILFIVEKEISEVIGRKYFDFKPYHYGPFDQGIYNLLDELEEKDLIEVINENRYNRYILKESGLEKGLKLLKNLPAEIGNYLEMITKWAVSCSFSELVSAIYNEYPDMKSKSRFRK